MSAPDLDSLKREALEDLDRAKRRLSALGFEPAGSLVDLDRVPAVKGGKLCLGMECLDRGLWDLKPALDSLSKLGIHSCRMQTGWARTEQTEGALDFSQMDEEVESALAAGYEPWLSLSYGNPVYYGGDPASLRAGGIGHAPLDTERERAAWRRYVAETVRRYRGRAKRYEIWNEPDIAVFFPYGDRWPERYMELVRLTAPVIRENDPDALVVGCTAGPSNMERLLTLGIADYIDLYSFHGYSACPETQDGALRQAIRAARDRFAPGLGLIRGEAGCPSYNAPSSIGALHDMKTSESVQARWASRHLIADLADPMLVETSYFHAFEFLHFSRRHHYYYGALRMEDCSRKPVFNVLQTLAHIFDGAASPAPGLALTVPFGKNQPMAESRLPLLRHYAFERNGLPLFAYWRADPPAADIGAEALSASIFPRPVLRRPVVLDTLTRAVYPISADPGGTLSLPVSDYAMILTEADALRPWLNGETFDSLRRGEVRALQFGQRVEE